MYHAAVIGSPEHSLVDDKISALQHELTVYAILKNPYDLRQVKDACYDLIHAIEGKEKK